MISGNNLIRRLRWVFAAVALLALPAAAQPPGHVSLWRAQGNPGSVYLLGSIHMLTADAYPLDPRILEAFHRSTEVVFEVDFGNLTEAVEDLGARSSLPEGETLMSLLSQDLQGRLRRELARIGLEEAAVKTMKPWFLALMLSRLELARAGYDPMRGIDLHLYGLAKEAGKKIRGLETARGQIELLDGLDRSEQVGVLRQTLAEIDELVPEVSRLTGMWRAGDAAGLERVLGETFRDTPRLYARLVSSRNRAWLPTITALTRRDQDTLVVVGVLHLVGSEGLVQLLRHEGIRVTQE